MAAATGLQRGRQADGLLGFLDQDQRRLGRERAQGVDDVAGRLLGGAVAPQKNAAQLDIVLHVDSPVGGIRPRNVAFFHEPQQQTQFIAPLGVVIDYEQSGLHQGLVLQGMKHAADKSAINRQITSPAFDPPRHAFAMLAALFGDSRSYNERIVVKTGQVSKL